MIYNENYIGDIYCSSSTGTNHRYICESVKDLPEDIIGKEFKTEIIVNLYKQCFTTDNHDEGIIIGFEINQRFCDYYYMVYVPSSNKVEYELAIDSEFVSSIH